MLDPNEPVYSAVAVQGDELVGFVNAVLHRSTWSVDNFCYLEDLYVAPTIRGGGTGKLLISGYSALPGNSSVRGCIGTLLAAQTGLGRLYNWVAENSGFIEYRMAL